MKIRLLLSYKGSQFFGWQRQKEKRTVQREAEKALFRLFRKKIPLIGSGRTDAGAHALGQNAHFELDSALLKNMSLKSALNHHLPEDISVLDCWKAPPGFHARFSALKKSYLYFIWTGDSPPVLFQDLVFWKRGDLDLKKLQSLARLILGERDWTSFQSSGSPVKSAVRRIYQSQWIQISPSLYRYKITGSGFLKQMARNLTGACLDLLRLKNPEQRLKSALEAKDRKQAFSAAPARGLYLQKVFYPPSLDRACERL